MGDALSDVSSKDAEKLLNIARNEIGYREVGNNWTKYGEWYPMQNNPWCHLLLAGVQKKLNFERYYS